ncbi:MAG TPA: hypothetical protein VML55_24200 [Planctomycetaceae bacterium]|nr:hypothetical protein [Planctomycetaceae bacterium]
MWRVSNFRFLIIVMSLGAFLMALEVTDSTPEAEKEVLYPYLMMQLYPERGESLLYRGVHAFAVEKNLAEARRLFEQAIATGLKTEEDLFYRYAEVLVQLEASEAEIESAVGLWRQHFPYSRRPDPREGPGMVPAARAGPSSLRGRESL